MKLKNKYLVSSMAVMSLLSSITTMPSPVSAQSDEIVRVGIQTIPDNLDPIFSGSNMNIKIFYNLFDSLFYTTKEGEPAGRIAKSWEWLDDTSLKVTINEGITFHNGEALTAEDVKYTYDRILSGYGNGTVATMYSTLESVTMDDDYTVTFKLKQKDSQFLLRLATVWAPGIVPKDYTEEIGEEAFAQKPVGAGPYELAEYTVDKIVLKRFEAYWGDQAPLAEVDFVAFPETAARMTALVAGDLDIASDIPIDQLPVLENYQDINASVIPIENIHVYTFKTNDETSIMSNIKFRQALTHAIDRETLISGLWNGNALEAKGLQLPSFGDLYIEDYDYPKYDPELAKQLVAESGYDGTEVIKIGMADGYYANGNAAGQAIVTMLKEVGINAQVEFVTSNSEPTQIGAWSNSARLSSPLGLVYSLWGPNSGPANPEKGIWTPTEEFIKAGETIAASSDIEEQREAARKLLEIYDTEAIGTYLYVPSDVYGLDDNIEWDTYFVKDKVTPFRAGDITIKDE